MTYEYSNYAYFLLGRIVTTVSGEPAMDYIERVLLTPLGMTSTTWHPDVITPSTRAQGYRWEDEQWREEQPLPSGGDVATFAGLCITVHDLSRWVGLFLSAWPPRNAPDNGPISRATLREMQQIGRPFDPYLEARAIGEPVQPRSGGYGFGLGTAHNARGERVGHGGGLPGFGSHMCWAPAYGVGVIALANVTYANAPDACSEALDTLIESSGLQPRASSPSKLLQQAHADLCRLLNRWDDKLADAMFVDNFFLDRDRDHWQKDFAALRASHSVFAPRADIKIGNWLRGKLRLDSERGWCQVSTTLAPTVPARIQALTITSNFTPSPHMQSVAHQLITLTARVRRRELDRLLAASCDRASCWKQLQLVSIEYGACVIGDIVKSDGKLFAEYTLEAENSRQQSRRLLNLELLLNSRGKIQQMTFLVE